MTKQTMSVQKALNELNLLDSRIEKETRNARFAAIKQKGVLTESSLGTEEDFKKNATGTLDSIKSLIANRNKIKSAIILSNAKTKVTIGNKTMTVAEAIERKTSIEYDRMLLVRLNNEYTTANQKVDNFNAKIDRELEDVLNKTLSSTEAKDNLESLRKTLEDTYDAKRAQVVQGVKNLKDVISDLELETDTFLSDVDFVLTESNVKTDIEVDLDGGA